MKFLDTNIKALKAEINELLASYGRQDEDFTLVAVSKTHPVELIEAALKLGITDIAENKVQEAMRKLPMLELGKARFHFIGRLQTNKINQLIGLKPALIHSIDSVYLAEKLNRALGNRNLTQDILIQVNVSGESQKSGVSFANALDTIWEIAARPNLNVKGLMTMGMLHPDPEHNRCYFKALKELFDGINADKERGLSLSYLSMGMSHDWRVAVSEGANMVRIGSAIFGARNTGANP